MTPQEKNVTVSAGVTRVPGHLRVTPTMTEDFLIDPILGIYVIFGVKLDVFQAYATRVTWWVPNVIDSSGFGTGKSFRIWLVTNLRAILIPNQQIVAYYQTFQAMKEIYWKNYQNFTGRMTGRTTRGGRRATSRISRTRAASSGRRRTGCKGRAGRRA